MIWTDELGNSVRVDQILAVSNLRIKKLPIINGVLYDTVEVEVCLPFYKIAMSLAINTLEKEEPSKEELTAANIETLTRAQAKRLELVTKWTTGG